MHITSIGIDLGKTTFHLVALGEQGKVVVRKKFSRKQLLAYTANLPSSLIGMEACSGRTSSALLCASQGHEVRLIPGPVRETFREVEQERLPGCGGHRRSRRAPEHAVRPHQDRGPARSPGSASGARPAGASPHGDHQPDSRFSAGAWHHLRQRASRTCATTWRHCWKMPSRTSRHACEPCSIVYGKSGNN